MSLWLSRTIVSGRRAGVAAMAGTQMGCVVHTLLAAFGVSALIATSATAFTILKVVGAAYLLWLAVDAIRNGSSLNVKTEGAAPASALSSFHPRADGEPHQPQGGAVLHHLPAAVRLGQ
jgi:threonine/homoserine/homoserine lactone efflux protein